jgi:glycine/D-amino acid oxidase-like deaminating enzyme
MTNLGKWDCVVIGGGVMGACIAWGMARAGVKPLVLDEGDLARRASRANFAMVFASGKGVGFPAYAMWCKSAIERWPQFAADLEAESGVDVELRQLGGLSFCMSQEELEEQAGGRARIARETGGQAAKYEVLDRQALRKLVPSIGPSVQGAIFSEQDGHANPLRLLYALHTAMAARGCRYHPDHGVRTIEPASSGFRILGEWGEVWAGKVVLAGGTDNQRLAPMVGMACPLTRDKGQILVTERCAPFFPYSSALICQSETGGITIGSTSDTVSESILTSQPLSAVIAKRAIQAFPALAALNIVRTWTGFRIMPPDGFPIYEQSASEPGAFVFASHSGISLASNHVLELAPRILAGRLGTDLAEFHSGRFRVSQAH